LAGGLDDLQAAEVQRHLVEILQGADAQRGPAIEQIAGQLDHQRQVIVLHRVLRGPMVLGVLVEYGVGHRWGFLRLVGQLAARLRALLRCSSVPPDCRASRYWPAAPRRAAPDWQVRWWCLL